MKTNILRCVAAALGLSVASVAQAQYGGYPATPGYVPQRPASAVPVHPTLQQNRAAQAWNNYHPQPTYNQPNYSQPPAQLPAQPFAGYQTASTGTGMAPPEMLPSVSPAHNGPMYGGPAPAPAPAPMYHQDPQPTHGQPTHGQPMHGGVDGSCSSCNGPQVGHIYQEAAGSSWGGHAPMQYGAPMACAPPVSYGPAPLRNWFAGGNLLFLDLVENGDRRLLFDAGLPLGTILSTNDVSPDSNVAFEVFFGRYFNCGQHALLVNYFNFNPSEEVAVIDAGVGTAGRNGNVARDYHAAIPGWENIMYDVGLDNMPGNDTSIGMLYEGGRRYRASRDVSFQGLELNLVSFGIGGARRAACGPMSVACGGCNSCGTDCGGSCGGQAAPSCGGACGPMVPACNNRLQIQTTHGLRWFQFKDRFDFAASQTDTTYGTTADDLYYDVDTENNLFGYQFGARLDYCLGHNLNVYAGTKMGIFANRAEFRSRLGTHATPGYVGNFYPNIAGQQVVVDNSDTVLATLGELDLGLGYRINNCWSVRGGYRLYGVSGVATSVGSIADDLANLPEAGQVVADDSLILHGGYVGAEYNW